MRLALFLTLSTVALSACGGGSSTPTGPSAPPPATPTPAPVATPTPSPTPSTGPTVLRAATIRGAAGHSASGTARILRDGEAFALELGDDFRIDSGHNDVMLTRNPGTRTEGDLNLGPMKSLRGLQSYPMPNNGASYAYVMLWCVPFRVTIGVGELR